MRIKGIPYWVAGNRDSGVGQEYVVDQGDGEGGSAGTERGRGRRRGSGGPSVFRNHRYPRGRKTLQRVGLVPSRVRGPKGFSTGMSRRLFLPVQDKGLGFRTTKWEVQPLCFSPLGFSSYYYRYRHSC